MNIVPIIFTYAADGPCALEAVGALFDAGFPVVYVAEDAFRPLLDETRYAAETLGAKFIPTHYQATNGGQYGRAVLAGIADAYAKVIEDTGADYVLKVDSDTVVAKTCRLRAAAAAGVAAAGWAWMGWEFSGCAALISATTVAELLRVCYGTEPLPRGLADADCPEDVATSVIARGVGEVLIWPWCIEGGYGSAYQYQHAKGPLEEYARRYDICTFGNRHLLPGTPCDQRAHVALTMAEYRRVLRSMDSSQLLCAGQ